MQKQVIDQRDKDRDRYRNRNRYRDRYRKRNREREKGRGIIKIYYIIEISLSEKNGTL